MTLDSIGIVFVAPVALRIFGLGAAELVSLSGPTMFEYCLSHDPGFDWNCYVAKVALRIFGLGVSHLVILFYQSCL